MAEHGSGGGKTRTPDLEGAERIYEYARLLLKDMSQAAAKLKEGTESG